MWPYVLPMSYPALPNPRLTLFLASLVWLFGASPVLADFSGTPTTFMNNGGWCWFQDPRVIITNGHLVIGTVAGTTANGITAGDETATDYIFSTGVTSVFTLKAAYSQDDHSSPAFTVLPDGRILAVYENHGGSNYVFWRVSTNVGDGSTWGAEQQSTVNTTNDGNGNTYNNPFYLSIDNTVHNTSRAIGYDPNHTKFTGINSTNNSGMTSAGNFAYHGHIIYWKNPSNSGNGRPYVKYASNGNDKIWFATTEDSPQNYLNSIYVGYMQFDSAGVGTMYDSTGTALGLMSTSTAPPTSTANQGSVVSGSGYSFLPTQFTPIAKDNTNYNGLDLSASSTYGAGYAPWGSSMQLDSSGKPYFGFVICRSRAMAYGNNLEYGYAHLVGGTWKVSRICYAGYALYSGQNQYAGLIAVDPLDPNKVYFSTNVNPQTGADLLGPDGNRHWQIFSGATTDDGATWSITQLTNTSSENLRPIIAAGNGMEALLWMQGTYTSYTNYNTKIVGLLQATTPAITSGTYAAGVIGSAFSYQITANNNPASFGATDLPAGLGVNTATGLISGTPSATGTTTVSLSATGTGGTVTGTLYVAVSPAPLLLSIDSPAKSPVIVTGTGTKLHLTASSPTATSYQWGTASGPVNAVFTDISNADTLVQFPQTGTYILSATASDTVQTATAQTTVTVNAAGTAQDTSLWLKLDETSGTVVADSSSVAATGTTSGGVVWQGTGGKIDGAAQFVSSNSSSITVPDSPVLDNASAFTLCYWFKAATIVDGGGIVGKRNAIGDNNAYGTFLKSDGRLYVDISGSNYDRFTSNTVFTTGAWYHVAVVFDGSKAAASRASLYVNGALDKTAAETSATVEDSNAPLRLGTLNSGAAYFNGYIDDVRIYRRALSATEVAAIASVAIAPAVSCGPAPSATSGVPAALSGSAGNNGGGAPSVAWSKTSGAGTATFFSPASPATNVTFGQAGAYVLRLSASNAAAEVCDEMNVTDGANTNVYADWISAAYPGVTNPAIVGTQADPDRDGVSNLTEHAIGLNPAATDAGTWTSGNAGLPVVSTTIVSGTDYLSLQVRRPIGRIGINYSAETSGSLTGWSAAVQNGAPAANGDGSETVIYRDTVPSTGASQRFIRLKVTQP
jgi:hypothetical protein